MKRLIVIILLLFPLSLFAQERVSMLSDLRARRGSANAWLIVESGSASGDAMGGIFLWDGATTLADNNRNVIRPDPLTPGGWVKSEPLSQKRGTSTFNYTTGQLSYTFSHGLTVAPVNLQYSIRSATIAGPSSWSATATSVTITFNALPVFLGTVPFTVCWIAYPY